MTTFGRERLPERLARAHSTVPSCAGRCGVCGKCWDVTVDVRTGELFWGKVLVNRPEVVEDNVFALRWHPRISGESQLGNGGLPGRHAASGPPHEIM